MCSSDLVFLERHVGTGDIVHQFRHPNEFFGEIRAMLEKIHGARRQLRFGIEPVEPGGIASQTVEEMFEGPEAAMQARVGEFRGQGRGALIEGQHHVAIGKSRSGFLRGDGRRRWRTAARTDRCRCISAWSPAIASSATITDGPTIAPENEIGRASCRERVCLYV